MNEIENKKQYEEAVLRLEELFHFAEKDEVKGLEFERLSKIIFDYENKQYGNFNEVEFKPL